MSTVGSPRPFAHRHFGFDNPHALGAGRLSPLSHDSLVAIIGEPAGGWGTSAQCTFKTIARNIAFLTGREAGDVLREQRQHLSIAVRRHRARAIFRRLPADPAIANNAAAAALAALAAEDD